MKTLVAVIVACLLSLRLLGQQVVNIELTSLTSTNCQITLYPSVYEVNTLSNVVFTLKWRSSRNITFSNPAPTSAIAIVKSGPVRLNGARKYQTFYGCGLQATQLGQPIIINIPRSGTGSVEIAVDSYVEQQAVNGKFYVSVGGQSATGGLVSTRSLSVSEIGEDLPIIMYYDTILRQFYVLRDGNFYNMVGQRVTLNDTTNLIVVHKSN